MSLATSQSAQAGQEGGITMFEMLFGGPSARNAARDHKGVASESCTGYDGIMGMVNGFFCHMEKDMGFTALGSKTVVFGTRTVHAEIASQSNTVTLGSYSVITDKVAKVWLCTSACTDVANFSRAFYIAFSYSGSGAVNLGYMVSEPGAFEGETGTAVAMIYDVGTSTTTKFVDLQAQFGSGNMKMRAVGTKVGSVMNINFAGMQSATAFRFAGSTDQSASPQYFKMYYERTGQSAAADAAGTGSLAAVSSACFSTVESGTSMTNTAASASSCSSLTLNAFDTSTTTVSGYSQATIWARSGTSWNGMTTNPTSI